MKKCLLTSVLIAGLAVFYITWFGGASRGQPQDDKPEVERYKVFQAANLVFLCDTSTGECQVSVSNEGWLNVAGELPWKGVKPAIGRFQVFNYYTYHGLGILDTVTGRAWLIFLEDKSPQEMKSIQDFSNPYVMEKGAIKVTWRELKKNLPK
jgi:hypothetical protein